MIYKKLFNKEQISLFDPFIFSYPTNQRIIKIVDDLLVLPKKYYYLNYKDKLGIYKIFKTELLDRVDNAHELSETDYINLFNNKHIGCLDLELSKDQFGDMPVIDKIYNSYKIYDQSLYNITK
jgi:hypothetical protein